jgi:hypothetical protein
MKNYCIKEFEEIYICVADYSDEPYYSQCPQYEEVEDTPVCGACLDGHCTSEAARAEATVIKSMAESEPVGHCEPPPAKTKTMYAVKDRATGLIVINKHNNALIYLERGQALFAADTYQTETIVEPLECLEVE